MLGQYALSSSFLGALGKQQQRQKREPYLMQAVKYSETHRALSAVIFVFNGGVHLGVMAQELRGMSRGLALS